MSDNAQYCIFCGYPFVEKKAIKHTSKEIFDEARKSYKKLTHAVKKLGLMLEEIDDLNFEIEDALIQIDCALQYILLLQAIHDGKLSEEERKFIELITDYGDVLQRLNRTGFSLEWKTLDLLNIDTIAKILDEMSNEYFDNIYRFTSVMAVADAYTESDLYNDIKQNIIRILKLLAMIDGDNSDFDRELFDEIFGKLFLARKNEVLESIDKDEEQTGPMSSK